MIPEHRLTVLLLAVFCALATHGRRRAVAAASAVALGGTALNVALGAGGTDLRGLPRLALTIDAGLELFGALLALSATVAAARSRELVPALLAGLGAVVAASSAARHVAAAGLIGPVALALAGAGVAVATWRVRRGAPGGPPRHAAVLVNARWLGAGAVATAVTVASPSSLVVIAAAMLLSGIGHVVLARRSARQGIPWLAVLVIPPLVLAGYLIITIAGPTGLSVAALREGPFSPAAEALLVALLAAGAVGFFGLRPLAGLVPGSLLAPAGVAIVVRLSAGVLPAGVAAWETVMIPAGVISLCIAAVARDAVAAGAAMAWIGCYSIGGAAGAWWLAGAASAGSALRYSPPITRSALAPLRAVSMGAGAWGAVVALDAVLRTETLYGVIAWLALTATLVRALDRSRD